MKKLLSVILIISGVTSFAQNRFSVDAYFSLGQNIVSNLNVAGFDKIENRGNVLGANLVANYKVFTNTKQSVFISSGYVNFSSHQLLKEKVNNSLVLLNKEDVYVPIKVSLEKNLSEGSSLYISFGILANVSSKATIFQSNGNLLMFDELATATIAGIGYIQQKDRFGFRTGLNLQSSINKSKEIDLSILTIDMGIRYRIF